MFLVISYNGAEASTFTDVGTEDWFYEDVMTLSGSGIIAGFPDGSFRPGSDIRVDQFIKLLVVALGHDLDAGETYWALPYIQRGYEIGLFEVGEFEDYSRPITRGEMATLISRGIPEEFDNAMYEYSFFMEDYPGQGSEEILKVFSMGIIGGYPDGYFYPENLASRAEASTMIMRLISERRRVQTHELKGLMAEFIQLRAAMDAKLEDYQEVGRMLLEEAPLRLDNGDEIYRIEGMDIMGYSWTNGDLYLGGMAEGVFADFGYFSWVNGTYYIGEMAQDAMHGRGLMGFDDAVYIGEFNQGKMTGQAMVVWEDEDTFIGSYREGVLSGLGMHRSPGGEGYIGEYLKGAKEGRGIFTFATGLSYFGTFNQEYRDGDEFTMYYSDSSDNAFEEAVQDILEEALSPGMGTNEKIRAIHDALAGHITYDYEGYDQGKIEDLTHTAYGALVEGRAVCDGYAEAFNLLLNRAGIASDLVIGEALDEGHAWNLVAFEEGFYHVDLTWNDLDNGKISDEHYKIDQDEIQKDHTIELIIR